MRKLDKLLLRSFVTPFITAFGVVLLLLVLQFLAKYIDDITGRGLTADIMAKIFMLSCGILVTMALPLGVLLASLTTMGNMGEHYELAAAKSSGISLVRLVRPLFLAVLVITAASMLYSFYVLPAVNLKFYTLLTDVSRVKPTFALKPDHFYSDIDGYVIFVSDINRERDILYDVEIHDNSKDKGNLRVVYGDSGVMTRSDNEDFLYLTLFNGVVHEALPTRGPDDKLAYRRIYYDTLEYSLKLSGFDLKESQDNHLAPHHYMKDIHELTAGMDSISRVMAKIRKRHDTEAVPLTHLDSAVKAYRLPKGAPRADWDSSVINHFNKRHRTEIYTRAVNQCRTIKNQAIVFRDKLRREEDKHRRFHIEWHYRVELPIACIVFLFLGASLGAIVRKGGLGYPVLFSVIFFILFYVLLIQGRKFARDEIMPVWMGVWLPVLVMLPFALAFTWQATMESSLFDPSAWSRFLKRILFFWRKRET